MVEVDTTTPLVGAIGTGSLLDAFEGRSQLFASYHMWHMGLPIVDQCEGFLCQRPYNESNRYREFMGWDMPWYSVPEASYSHLAVKSPHEFRMKAYFLCDSDQGFETYWTTGRGCEPLSSSYGMLDLTVYGRQELWEGLPNGWSRQYQGDGDQFRSEEGQTSTIRHGISGRPIPQWARLAAGNHDHLSSTGISPAEYHCHQEALLNAIFRWQYQLS